MIFPADEGQVDEQTRDERRVDNSYPITPRSYHCSYYIILSGKFVSCLTIPKLKTRLTYNTIMEQFTWITFFEELADKLLEYKNNRQALLDIVYKIPAEYVKYLHEEDGSELDDICPFTVIGIMNRNQTFDNRIKIMSLFKQYLGIKADIPADFVGIPTLNPQRSWFFGYENIRKQHDIDNLWSLFQAAIEYADKGNEHETEFISCYNTAIKQYSVKWNITQGLYWIRPNFYVSLDGPSRDWLEDNGINHFGNNPPSGQEYLDIRDKVDELAKQGYNGMKSIPEFIADAVGSLTSGMKTVDTEDIFDEEFDNILKLLEHKKQIILQGAPGTGKTYMTAALAVALCDGKENLPSTRKEIMEQYDEFIANKDIAFTTFHQSMDYEDFIEGIKPVKNNDGGISYEVRNGIFKTICNNAGNDKDKLPFVLIIDEINRGNISKILGELITLLEADKRLGADNQVTVTLPYSGENFGVPSNLYIIGTMNTADRSVGYIDYAVRRRFAFFTIKASRKAIENYYGDNDELCDIALGYFDEVNALFDNLSNEFDKDDVMVGHSYFMAGTKEELDLKMEYEVRPLLLEYVRDGVLNIKKDSDEYKKIANYPASPEATANDDDN